MPAMRDPATGQIVEVPADQVDQAIRAGYAVETPAEQLGRLDREVAAERTGGVGGAVEAFAAGTLRGGTLGFSDAGIAALGTQSDIDRLAELRRERPIASVLGEVTGGVGTALVSAGTGIVGSAARLTPSGALAGLSGRVLGAAEGAGAAGRIGAGVAAGALEGAGGGAGAYLTEIALEDKPLSAEGFLASARNGALWGGVAGGALAAGERAFVAARKLFPKAAATREATEAAERRAVDEIDSAIRDGDALESVARRRIDEITATARATDPDIDAAIRRLEAAAAAPPGRTLDEAEVGALISGKGRVKGGRVVGRIEPEPTDLEATLRASLEKPPVPKAAAREADPEQARRVAMRERAKETLAAAKRARGEAPAPDVPPTAAAAPEAAAPATRLERELSGTLKHVQGGGELGAAPHVARRQVLDEIDEIVARMNPEAKVLIDASRDLRMSAGEVRDWVEQMRRRGGAGTLSAAPRRNLPLGAESRPTPGGVLADSPAAAPTVEDAIRAGLRIPAREADDAVADIAANLGRHEAANANLADALGDLAPPSARARAEGQRAAEARVVGAQGRVAAEIADDVGKAASGRDPGMLGTIADLGAAYEVMRALGVPLPSPSSIPVIGPVLGVYFKARAASTVFRRLGGRVPLTAEAMIARGAAQTRERVYRAVDGMLSVGARAAKKAEQIRAPRAAAILATRLYDDGEPAPKRKDVKESDLVRDRVSELARSSAPGAVANVIRRRFPMADPALTDELAAGLQRRLDYLRKHAPLDPIGPTMLRGGRSDWTPSQAEILKFARRIEAVDDPAGVLERAATSGGVTIEAAEAIRAVYPRLFADAQMRLIQRAAELKERLPYTRRVMLSVLFDVPLDGTTDPEYVAFLQSGFAPQADAAAAPPGGAQAPMPSIAGDVNAGVRATMRLDQP